MKSSIDFKLIQKDYDKGYFDALRGIYYEDSKAYNIDDLTCLHSFVKGFNAGSRS